MRFDVAVVGSGPAGATTALLLARQGLKVLLLDKERLPRYKTCGGGLVGRALASLPTDVEPVVERHCRSAELHLLDDDLHFATHRAAPVISMTMRDRLDFALASGAAAAGAELRAPCRVTGVRLENHHVRLETDRGPAAAALVVAADGATSEVARQAGWRDQRHLAPALEHEMRVDDRALERFAGAPRFDAGIVPHGYAWVFPKAAHLSVGVLSTRRGPVNLPRCLERYLEVLGIVPRSAERHGFVIPLRPRAGPVVRNRVLLVGDAAGLADPLTAEGISLAARSARCATAAILEGELDEARVRAAYQRGLGPLIGELRVARALARLLYDHPRMRRWIFRQLGQQLVEVITDVSSGARTYTSLVAGLVAALGRRLVDGKGARLGCERGAGAEAEAPRAAGAGD